MKTNNEYYKKNKKIFVSYGGGIYVGNAPNSSFLFICNDTIITSNHAFHAGGGVFGNFL